MNPFLDAIHGGIVAIFRGETDEVRLIDTCDALVAAGVAAVEITLDSPGALGTIERLAGRFQGRAHVGAGTVLDAEAAQRAVQAGAAFIVAPGLDEATVRAAQQSGTPVLPGVFTATEALTARRLGCHAVKLFPAGPVGPGYVAALRGPIADVAIVPTGGIGLADVRAYLGAGAHAVGLGGALTKVPPERIGASVRQAVGDG